MIMVATFTAVATPHALILTVSHDFLFHQPLLLVDLPNPPDFASRSVTRRRCVAVPAMIAH
jgi:hypothetical protein